MIAQKNNQEDVKVLVGQPTNYPDELLAVLSECFKTKNVKRAYIACVQYPAREETLRLVIGIETSDDLLKLVSQLEERLNLLSQKVDKIDFVHAANSPYKDYFNKISPFYFTK